MTNGVKVETIEELETGTTIVEGDKKERIDADECMFERKIIFEKDVAEVHLELTKKKIRVGIRSVPCNKNDEFDIIPYFYDPIHLITRRGFVNEKTGEFTPDKFGDIYWGVKLTRDDKLYMLCKDGKDILPPAQVAKFTEFQHMTSLLWKDYIKDADQAMVCVMEAIKNNYVDVKAIASNELRKQYREEFIKELEHEGKNVIVKESEVINNEASDEPLNMQNVINVILNSVGAKKFTIEQLFEAFGGIKKDEVVDNKISKETFYLDELEIISDNDDDKEEKESKRNKTTNEVKEYANYLVKIIEEGIKTDEISIEDVTDILTKIYNISKDHFLPNVDVDKEIPTVEKEKKRSLFESIKEKISRLFKTAEPEQPVFDTQSIPDDLLIEEIRRRMDSKKFSMKIDEIRESSNAEFLKSIKDNVKVPQQQQLPLYYGPMGMGMTGNFMGMGMGGNHKF